MRVYMVNEGTLRKPQGPCYAFAVFLQLKEVHLFSVKSHCVTANWEYFKSIMNKHKISPVSESTQVTFGQRFCERNPKHQDLLSAWNTTGWGSFPCTKILHVSFNVTWKTDMQKLVCVTFILICPPTFDDFGPKNLLLLFLKKGWTHDSILITLHEQQQCKQPQQQQNTPQNGQYIIIRPFTCVYIGTFAPL